MGHSLEQITNSINREATKEILESLEEDDLEKWGFVIYRCTYTSVEKWNRFISALQEVARDSIKKKVVSDALTWTIFEDRETLDGASVLDASRKVLGWVKVEGMKELEDRQVQEDEDEDEGEQGGGEQSGKDEDDQGGGEEEDPSPYPRCKFFICVDEEMLESLTGYVWHIAVWGQNYFKLIHAEMIVSDDDNKEARAKEMRALLGCDEWSHEDRMADLILDLVRRVDIREFVGVYAFLVDVGNWENFIRVHCGISDFSL